MEWFHEDFPRTLTLKIKRKIIQDHYEGKTKETQYKAKDRLMQLLSDMSGLPPSKIKEKSLLYKDLKFDSLKVIELTSSIEEKIRVEIDEHLLTPATTVKNLRTIISESGKKKKDVALRKNMFSPLLKPKHVQGPTGFYGFDKSHFLFHPPRE